VALVPRLFKQINRAGLSRDQQEPATWVLPLEQHRQINTIHARHAHIGDDQFRVEVLAIFDGALGAIGTYRVVSRESQDCNQGIGNTMLIVHNQYSLRLHLWLHLQVGPVETQPFFREGRNVCENSGQAHENVGSDSGRSGISVRLEFVSRVASGLFSTVTQYVSVLGWSRGMSRRILVEQQPIQPQSSKRVN